MLPITPRGFKDVLPREARWRESITDNTKTVLARWGYDPIETPTLEILEVLEQGGLLKGKSFRLFDTDNELLVLRPDVTLPVARMVASRLKTTDLPLRFRYVQRVFREQESLKAMAREYTQIGIESIGMDGPAADAEVVLVLIDALEACGLKDFSIAICTVGVLQELLAAVMRMGSVDMQWRDQMLAAYHASNLVEIEKLASDERVDMRYRTALKLLSTINGGGEAIAMVRELVLPLDCLDGLEDLEATWQIIEGLGRADRVRIDFSVMSTFNYYSGLVMEAFAPGVGTSLGTGGRYDRMLEAYGKHAPAAGFAFYLETVMYALLAQDCTDEASAAAYAERVELLLPQGDDVNNKTAIAKTIELFQEAARLRALGSTAVLSMKAPPSEGEIQ